MGKKTISNTFTVNTVEDGKDGVPAITGYCDYLFGKDAQGNNKPAASAAIEGAIDLMYYTGNPKQNDCIDIVEGSASEGWLWGAWSVEPSTAYIWKGNGHVYRATNNGWEDEGQFNGKDGATQQQIFYRNSNNQTPSTPATSQSDAVPSGWSATPQGVSDVYKYEWVSMRTKTNGVWGAYSQPAVFAYHAEDGTSIRIRGGAIEFVQGTWPDVLEPYEADLTTTNIGDIILFDESEDSTDHARIIKRVQPYIEDDKEWNFTTEVVPVGEGYLIVSKDGQASDEGHLYVAKDWSDEGDYFYWQDCGRIKGEKGDKGDRGKIGRFFYFGGVWENIAPDKSFDLNDAQAPYFQHTVDGQKRYHVFNPQTNQTGGTITKAQMWATSSDWNNEPWEVMTNDFDYLITKAIFGSYAQFGSAIINGDWLLSTNGTINGDAYNNGALYNNSPAYTWFDPQYPNKSVNTTHNVNGKTWTGYNFVPNYAVDLLTGATYQQNAFVKGHVEATSGSFENISATNSTFENIVANDSTFSGNMRTPYTIINDSNFSEYMEPTVVLGRAGYRLKIEETGLNVQITLSNYNEIIVALPTPSTTEEINAYLGAEANILVNGVNSIYLVATTRQWTTRTYSQNTFLVRDTRIKLKCVLIGSSYVWVPDTYCPQDVLFAPRMRMECIAFGRFEVTAVSQTVYCTSVGPSLNLYTSATVDTSVYGKYEVQLSNLVDVDMDYCFPMVVGFGTSKKEFGGAPLVNTGLPVQASIASFDTTNKKIIVKTSDLEANARHGNFIIVVFSTRTL